MVDGRFVCVRCDSPLRQEEVTEPRRLDPNSQLATHVGETGLTFHLQRATVLDRGNTKTERLTLEAWFSDAHSINRHLDLPAAYKVLRHHNRRAQDQTTTPGLSRPYGDSPTASLLGEEEPPDRPPDTGSVTSPRRSGRSTVTFDRVDHRNKAFMLLNDRESYKVSDAASLKSLLAKINRIRARLKEEKVITVKDWYMAKPTETPMARFYGLPKVHMPDVLLRPIVSLRGTLTYGLANWLFQKLRFLTAGSQTTVHSAEQLLDRTRAVMIEPNERMVSLDVVSLFTSIPQALAVETHSDLLHQNYDKGDGQHPAQDFIELTGHCLKTFFTFEGITYEQIKDTPTGSPISGLTAERVLQKLEKRLFEEYKPKFWARYVDDTFVIIGHDKINFCEELLSLIIPDIQFTTNTLQMLIYNSNHPLHHKRSCVRALYRQVDTHCSTPAAKLDEVKLLQELFRANGYPRAFVERSRRQPRKRNKSIISQNRGGASRT
ncbi:hypothetical protein SprV_0802505800 [Sparganum proliferum]